MGRPDGQMDGQGRVGRVGKVRKVLQDAIWERGAHLLDRRDEACQGARSRRESLMGWVTVKKKARRREGTAGTQAGESTAAVAPCYCTYV